VSKLTTKMGSSAPLHIVIVIVTFRISGRCWLLGSGMQFAFGPTGNGKFFDLTFGRVPALDRYVAVDWYTVGRIKTPGNDEH